ncbi:MAG: thioredoxin family protein [Bacteroidales bacterium]|nr:thioredoxin family protein [Bacteroidales bacterium]
MKKTLIFAAVLASAVGIQSCKTTMISPDSMASVNFGRDGSLKADKVTMTGKETTVHFTMNYPTGRTFRYGSDSYLMDEAGRRYPLRSADGIELDNYKLTVSDSGNLHFSMTFDPLPKKTKIFDFIEGDVERAFGLLGIRDKKSKLKAPTLQEIASANPYRVPDDWFRRDTVTVRGRIEGYDAEKFGFSTMQCSCDNVFEMNSNVQVIEIAADGSFEKKFAADYPVLASFRADKTKVGFREIPFFVRPGETVDVTVRKNDKGKYECFYGDGSSKDVERLLKSKLYLYDVVSPLYNFKGKIAEIAPLADSTWNNLMWRVQLVAQREKFTPQEVQMALAEAQSTFAYGVLTYVMHQEIGCFRKDERGVYHSDEIVDSTKWLALCNMKYYEPLHRVDFDNPLLLVVDNSSSLENRVEYARPINAYENDSLTGEVEFMGKKFYVPTLANSKQKLKNRFRGYRDLMGCGHNSLMAQICVSRKVKYLAKQIWLSDEDKKNQILADTTLAEEERKARTDSMLCISNMMPDVLPMFSHPYVRENLEQFLAEKIAHREFTIPLPENNWAADFVRDFNKKYPGRYLVFDFWGMGCAPCRSAIERSKSNRAEIAKRDDVKLVFVAEERTAGGSEAYKKYVEKWLADEETVCLSAEDFSRLRELFRFNGIPHYETITPSGRRVRDDLQMHGFGSSFQTQFDRMKERVKE